MRTIAVLCVACATLIGCAGPSDEHATCDSLPDVSPDVRAEVDIVAPDDTAAPPEDVAELPGPDVAEDAAARDAAPADDVAQAEDAEDAVDGADAGCPYVEDGVCPPNWQCIPDPEHPRGGYCGCTCPDSFDHHRCSPDGGCGYGGFILAPSVSPGFRPDGIEAIWPFSFDTPDQYPSLWMLFDYTLEPHEVYDPIATTFVYLLPGATAKSRAEAEELCSYVTIGGGAWRWHLVGLRSLAAIAAITCPDMTTCRGDSLDGTDGVCPDQPGNCWPFPNMAPDHREFWTSDSLFFSFSPGGTNDTNTGSPLSVACRGIYDPDGI